MHQFKLLYHINTMRQNYQDKTQKYEEIVTVSIVVKKMLAIEKKNEKKGIKRFWNSGTTKRVMVLGPLCTILS